MILELDCGNSLIKWRVLNEQNERVLYGVASDASMLVEALAEVNLVFARLVSVRSDLETQEMVAAIEAGVGVKVHLAKPSLQQGGVRNGYEDYSRLGLDRWLAVVAGYHLANGACLVLDLGTAVTADLVDANGVHLGGFICPGIELMRGQLRQHTRRIRYQAQDLNLTEIKVPGRNTADAVERGCLLMLKNFAVAQVELARELLGQSCKVYVTGGDANLVMEDLDQAIWVEDLVFKGLAVCCPQG